MSRTRKKIWCLKFFFPPTRHKNLYRDLSPIEYTENGLTMYMWNNLLVVNGDKHKYKNTIDGILQCIQTLYTICSFITAIHVQVCITHSIFIYKWKWNVLYLPKEVTFINYWMGEPRELLVFASFFPIVFPLPVIVSAVK